MAIFIRLEFSEILIMMAIFMRLQSRAMVYGLRVQVHGEGCWMGGLWTVEATVAATVAAAA